MIWSIMDHKMALILDQLKNDATAASLECIRCTRIEATALGRSWFWMQLISSKCSMAATLWRSQLFCSPRMWMRNFWS